MAALFDITTSTNTLFLNEVRQGETSFTVTNVDAARRMLQARAHIIPNDASTTGWYTIAGDSQRNFIAGASSEYVVRIQVPQTAPAGFYDFHLLIVEEDDPDENFVEGPSIRLEVRPTLPPAISPAMTIIMIALLVIVVLGGIGFVGWAIVNTAQLANETAALRGVNEILLATATDPALVEHNGILYLAHRGTGQDADLYWSAYDVVADYWSGGLPLNQGNTRTAASPALVEHNGILYLFYRGADDDTQLYWARYTVASDSWQRGTAIPVASSTSSARPAVVEYDGVLYLVFRGAEDDSRLYLATYGIESNTWVDAEPITLVNNIVLRSASGGALVEHHGTLHLFFTPDGDTLTTRTTYNVQQRRWTTPETVLVESASLVAVYDQLGILDDPDKVVTILNEIDQTTLREAAADMEPAALQDALSGVPGDLLRAPLLREGVRLTGQTTPDMIKAAVARLSPEQLVRVAQSVDINGLRFGLSNIKIDSLRALLEDNRFDPQALRNSLSNLEVADLEIAVDRIVKSDIAARTTALLKTSQQRIQGMDRDQLVGQIKALKSQDLGQVFSTFSDDAIRQIANSASTISLRAALTNAPDRDIFVSVYGEDVGDRPTADLVSNLTDEQVRELSTAYSREILPVLPPEALDTALANVDETQLRALLQPQPSFPAGAVRDLPALVWPGDLLFALQKQANADPVAQLFLATYDGLVWNSTDTPITLQDETLFTATNPTAAAHDNLIYLIYRGYLDPAGSDDPGIYWATYDMSRDLWIKRDRIRIVPDGVVVFPTPTPIPDQRVSVDLEVGAKLYSTDALDTFLTMRMAWAQVDYVWDGEAAASTVKTAIDRLNLPSATKVLVSVRGERADLADADYLNKFANFLGAVAAESRVTAIEVWNDQNIESAWPAGQIDPANYTEMLNKAYDAIKSADRDNPEEVIVISGAPRATGFFNGDCTPTGCDDAPFLQGMVSAGADEFMDCVGIRYLEGAAGPDVQAAGLRGHSTHYSLYYPTMVAIYSNAFPDKPLCFTGLGYFAPPEQAALSPQYAWAANTTSEDQARWLGRAVEVARTSRLVQIMIIQNVDATVASNGLEQAGYAMIRSDGTCSACNRVRAALR